MSNISQKIGQGFGVVLITLIGSALFASFIPIWVFILAMFVFILYMARHLNLQLEDNSTFETTMSAWTTSLYQREESRPQLRQSWNCKNCGGPNVEQVKCQYCGMVKE